MEFPTGGCSLTPALVELISLHSNLASHHHSIQENLHFPLSPSRPFQSCICISGTAPGWRNPHQPIISCSLQHWNSLPFPLQLTWAQNLWSNLLAGGCSSAAQRWDKDTAVLCTAALSALLHADNNTFNSLTVFSRVFITQQRGVLYSINTL